jgi:hypothetical protein
MFVVGDWLVPIGGLGEEKKRARCVNEILSLEQIENIS